MLKIAFYLTIGYAILLIFLYISQRGMIYYPDSFAPTPKAAGVPEMEVVTLNTKDGLDLKAWYRAAEQGKPTIVFFHGNAGNIGNRAFIVKPFIEKGYGFLLVSYRGYSGNPGSPYEEGLYLDGRAAMQFLEQAGHKKIILYGNSIGGAVAMKMATEFTVDALILQSPFTSLADVGQYHYRFFPVRWLTKDRFDAITLVNEIHVPVFIIHGEEDWIIPAHFSEKLYKALGDPKERVTIPGKGHNNLFEPNLVIEFIEQTMN